MQPAASSAQADTAIVLLEHDDVIGRNDTAKILVIDEDRDVGDIVSTVRPYRCRVCRFATGKNYR